MQSFASNISQIKSLGELTTLFEIAHDEVLTKDTYIRPIRSYELIKPEAQCQFLKRNKSCGQSHQHGYVVETSAGKQVLIGHCCALNHLGLDDEKIRTDFRQLTAAERAAIRRIRVEQLLAQKEQLIQEVKQALADVRDLKSEASVIIQALPAQVVSTLYERWKRGATRVTCEYLMVRTGDDGNGKKIKEKNWYPHDCGTLKGLGPWLMIEEEPFTVQLYQFLHALEDIPLKKRLTNAELATAESVLNSLAHLNVLKREIKHQREAISDFKTLSNILIAVQLFANRLLRAEVVKTAHLLTGESIPSMPSKLVDAIDHSIRQLYSADGLRIAS